MSLESPALSARRRCLALGLGAAAGLVLRPAQAAAPATLSAAGASFPSKVYQRWARQYAELSGVRIDYKPTGSGDGIQQAIARKVPLAGTDAPLKPEDLSRHRLVQLPMLVGGITPVVNLPGLEGLRLSGELLADIMLGAVSRWDDPRIAELNRGLNLPGRRIVRVVRADKSGTSEGFTGYLAGASAAFRAGPGQSSLPAWPGEVQAAPGNDGVSGQVRATPGAIGYVSHDRVESDRLSAVVLRNRSGQWVSASEAGFRSAIFNSDLNRQGDDLAPLLDRTGQESWPITMTSFLLLDAQPATAAEVEAAMRFVWWCFMHGDQLTRGTGFAPLPVSVQAKLVARLGAVAPRQGARPSYQQY